MPQPPIIATSSPTALFDRYPVRCAGMALLYFALATTCISLTDAMPDHVAAVWWPNALVLAVLLRSARERWWGFIAAAATANLAANLTMGYQPLLSPALALSDAAEIALALFLLRGHGRHLKPERNARDLVIALVAILGIGATVSSTLAAAAMHMAVDTPFGVTWQKWWMAEFFGMVSLLPLALSLNADKLRQLFSSRRALEFVALSALSLGSTFFALQWMPFPFVTMMLPLLLVAMRVGFFGTALIGFFNALLMLTLTLKLAPSVLTALPITVGNHLLLSTALMLIAPQMVALLIEQRDRTLARLRQSEKVFRDSMRYAPIGMLLVTRDGYCFGANPAGCEILGYSEDELRAIHMGALCLAEDIEAMRTITRAVIEGSRTHATLERRYIRKDGRHVWCQTSIAGARDADGNVLYLIAQVENIDARKQHERQREALQRELEHRARHDSLTGLINRQSFEHTLEAILGSRADDRQHSLCFIDLDRFKILNDSAGHAAGDLLLRQLAQRLQKRVRSHDVLARLGGDEFGLLLPDCSSEDASRLCAQLIDSVNALHFSWEGSTFTLGASIGVVPFQAGHLSLNELMSRADVACYSAKNEGRNRVVIYAGDDSVAARNHQQIQIAASIREALEAGRFALYAQPIVPLNTTLQQLRPIELLVRLRTREGQLLSPAAFIPAAERYGLMAAIDRWVIAHALLEHGHALASHRDVGISINLSGTSFNDPDFADYLRSVIRNSPFTPERICFEITETAMVNNIVQAAELVQLLKGMGCRVALDDFGSGLSSFNYLKNFAVDVVKIDGSFVRGLAGNRIDRAIVESINQIAHQLGARTVAEFVESAEVAAQLREIGVDYAQGYHYARPEPLIGLLQRLAQDSPALTAE
jgi:diguanylate cyclase (GGDEF)-like protein/PAS domain S-box-containing protein